jgi:hypothetical protein
LRWLEEVARQLELVAVALGLHLVLLLAVLGSVDRAVRFVAVGHLPDFPEGSFVAAGERD